MTHIKNYGLLNLVKRTLAVITTSLGLLSNHESKGTPQIPGTEEENDHSRFVKLNKKGIKLKLVLAPIVHIALTVRTHLTGHIIQVPVAAEVVEEVQGLER